jgi:hypothetical protein
MNALATADDVTAAADSLSAAADILRKRLEREIARGTLTQEQAQQLNDDEALLRLQANDLYADAATLVVSGLPLAQERLLAAIDQAAARIAKLEKLTTLLSIATDLAAIAGAILARKANVLASAVKKLQADSAAYTNR